MKIRSLFVLLGLAIGFAGPTFAQVDPKVEQQIRVAGNEVHSTGKWSCVHKSWSGSPGNADGYYSWVIVREGDAWKIRKNTATGSGGIL